MARMNWKRLSQDIRFVKEKKGEFAETRHIINRVCLEQKIANEKRRKEDFRRALILQAAVKAGIYHGPIPVGPTIRRKDTPDALRKEQRKRARFNQTSRVKTDDKHFKKEDRRWNEGNQNDGASLNPV